MNDSEIKEAAKLTKRELNFVDDTCDALFTEEGQRPLVYIAVCAHIIGCLVHGSHGTLTTDDVINLVRETVQV